MATSAALGILLPISRAELQTKQISELRALIRVVLEGIRDLQRIGNEPLPSDDDNDRAF